MWKYLEENINDITTRQEKLKLLSIVLEKIKTTRFLVNLKKAQMALQIVTYLEVELEAEGHRPDAQCIELICKLPAPQDVPTLRSFLGLTGLSREFIEGYSERALPLHLLLKKGQSWMWGNEQKAAFTKLKQALTAAPALACPKRNQLFLLQLGTTDKGLSYTVPEPGLWFETQSHWNKGAI